MPMRSNLLVFRGKCLLREISLALKVYHVYAIFFLNMITFGQQLAKLLAK